MSNDSTGDMAMDSVADLMKGEEDTDHVAQALSSAMDNLDNVDVITLFTELDMEEIKILSVLKSVDNELLHQFADEYMEQKVSHKRQGRKELIQVAEAFSNIWGQEQESRLDKLRSKMSL